MKDLRIGCLNYINALPLFYPFQLQIIENDLTFIYDVPTTLNTLLRAGEIDVALTSSIEYLEGDYQLLPDFGIAGFANSLSVNLYSQFPLQSLTGKRIGLTHHSATAAALLKVLCHHFWQIEPEFETLNRHVPFAQYGALLLIGDEALQNPTIPNFETIDLCGAWHAFTGHPFVFAVIAARKKMDIHTLALLKRQIEAALRWSDENREMVVEKALKMSSLKREVVHNYYSILKYRLSILEMTGLKMFKQLKESTPV